MVVEKGDGESMEEKEKRKDKRGKQENDKEIKEKTSLTEFRHQMRSGDLPAYLYLNSL